jgi:hypothetical protein
MLIWHLLGSARWPALHGKVEVISIVVCAAVAIGWGIYHLWRGYQDVVRIGNDCAAGWVIPPENVTRKWMSIMWFSRRLRDNGLLNFTAISKPGFETDSCRSTSIDRGVAYLYGNGIIDSWKRRYNVFDSLCTANQGNRRSSDPISLLARFALDGGDFSGNMTDSKHLFPEWHQRNRQWWKQIGGLDQPKIWPLDFGYTNNTWHQSVQGSNVCSITAGAQIQAFMIHKKDRRKTDVLDITKHLRMSDGEFKYMRIFENAGLDAKTFLDEILLVPGLVKIAENKLTYAKLCPLLDQYGPMLMSHFVVDTDFRDSGRDSFDAFPGNASKVGQHAMALIGVRKDGLGKTWLLVQNWWTHMQFVEMSLDYYKAHADGDIWAVEHPQTGFKQGSVTHQFQVTETVDNPHEMVCELGG